MSRKNSYLTATDQFCGAGGSTSGAKAAGVEVKMALNHWKLAIETHNTNHPETAHDCTDIQACDPRRYPSTDILITSPECTNHTLAKGQKRLHQAQYDMFGKGPDASEERSRATMFDVPRFAEYHNYNIIIVENVVEARKWRLWDGWLKCMHDLGYKHKCLYLNSSFFHPCPQSRDRMYIVFWKAGNREPDLEHSPLGHCNHCEARKELYQSWKNPQKRSGKFRQQYVYRCSACNNETMPFYFASFNCIDWTIPGEKIGDRKKPLADNTIKRIEYGLKKYAGQSIVVTTRYSSGMDCRVKLTTDILPTQPGDACHGVATPFTLNLEHSKIGDERVKSSLDTLLTQTTAQATGFVVPFIINLKKTTPARSFLEQMATVAASGNHHMLISNYSPGYAKTLEQPTGAITTQDHHGLFRIPIIVENKGMSNAKDATSPLATVTTHDYLGLLSDEKLNAFLMQYYNGSHVVSKASDAIRTVTTGDRSGLFIPKTTRIEDCFYRMLKPHEIQAAMAFADDYIVLGNSRDKVKQLGNAVTPPVMEWIVGQCVKSLN